MDDSSREARKREKLLRLAKEIRIYREERSREAGEGGDGEILAAYLSEELAEGEKREVESMLAGSPDLEHAVRIASDTLDRHDWRTLPSDVALDIHPPVLVGSERRRTLWLAESLRRRPRAWLYSSVGLLAALLMVAVVVRPLRPRAAPRSDAKMAVYRCRLDQAGRVAAREPLAPGQPLRSGESFQVEVWPGDLNGVCLLHIDPVGGVRVLYQASRSDAGSFRTVALPAPERAYRLDETCGLETLVLLEDEGSALELARTQEALDQIMSRSVVRGTRRRVTDSEVAELVSVLANHSHVATSVVIDHRPK